MRKRRVAGLLLLGALAGRPATGQSPSPPSIVLITLDTTRADRVGSRQDGAPLTPNLDVLARSGTRYANALTASPLTLPAHCSLMTGLDPPSHGVRDNGVASLPEDVPTLSAAFSRRGYATGAVVASRVLDRRFGLARGFDAYDDAMVAEQVGEQGYPERDAAAVTGAALAWASKLPSGRPYFLWVHYYDPHAPYEPPGRSAGASAPRRYAGRDRLRGPRGGAPARRAAGSRPPDRRGRGRPRRDARGARREGARRLPLPGRARRAADSRRSGGGAGPRRRSARGDPRAAHRPCSGSRASPATRPPSGRPFPRSAILPTPPAPGPSTARRTCRRPPTAGARSPPRRTHGFASSPLRAPSSTTSWPIRRRAATSGGGSRTPRGASRRPSPTRTGPHARALARRSRGSSPSRCAGWDTSPAPAEGPGRSTPRTASGCSTSSRRPGR